MEFKELVKARRSCRAFDGSPVSEQQLNAILDAGLWAPNPLNLQPWEFLVVSSSEMLKKIHPSYPRSWFINAPLVLIVKGKKDDAWVRRYDGYNSIETDLTIAMDHIILAAEYENIGTCWIEAYDPRILSTAIGLKENEVVFSITPLGYQNKGYKKQVNKLRKSLKEIVKII